MWPVVFVLEARPVRWGLYLLLFGAAKGAAAGEVFGVLWCVLVAGLLWWRPMLAFGRGVADAVAWCRDRIG